MKKYEELLTFITDFENPALTVCQWTEASQDSDGVWTLGYPNYTERFKEFIQLVSGSDLMDTDYMDNLQHWLMPGEEFKSAIGHSDYGLLKAIFTYLIRQERFRDGSWESSAADGSFLAALKRLEELTYLQNPVEEDRADDNH